MLPICYQSTTRMLLECYKSPSLLSGRFRAFQVSLQLEHKGDTHGKEKRKGGAGGGNRTRLASLEGWSITTMLRPLKGGRNSRKYSAGHHPVNRKVTGGLRSNPPAATLPERPRPAAPVPEAAAGGSRGGDGHGSPLSQATRRWGGRLTLATTDGSSTTPPPARARPLAGRRGRVPSAIQHAADTRRQPSRRPPP